MWFRGILVFVLLCAGGIVISQSSASSASTADTCARWRAAAAVRADFVSGSGERVNVIGDSYSVGLGLGSPARSWPTRLPGTVHVDGFSGSGFSAGASPCAQVAYDDRAADALRGSPSLIVVEGGLNDFDAPTAAIEAGARRVLRVLAGHRVVVVGPVSAPSRAAQVPRVDAALARVSREFGVDYLSTKDWRLPYLADRLHLTAAGHAEFGDRVAAWLRVH